MGNPQTTNVLLLKRVSAPALLSLLRNFSPGSVTCYLKLTSIEEFPLLSSNKSVRQSSVNGTECMIGSHLLQFFEVRSVAQLETVMAG
jgi:hypothetical protein